MESFQKGMDILVREAFNEDSLPFFGVLILGFSPLLGVLSSWLSYNSPAFCRHSSDKFSVQFLLFRMNRISIINS